MPGAHPPRNDELRPTQGRRFGEQTGQVSASMGPADDNRQHVARVIQRAPAAASYDVDTWLAAIAQWETPLPADRPSLRLARRHRPTPVGRLAPFVARTFTPPAGTIPQPRCPNLCWRTHQDAA